MCPWAFSVVEISRRALLRRRWSMLPALAVVATLGGSAGGQSAEALSASGRDPGALSCVTSRLASLGGGHGNAIAVSSTGVAVGIADDAALRSHPVVWQNGRVTRIRTTLAGAVPVAVNKDGVVVGTAFDPRSEMPVGWYWNGKRVRLLPTDPGDAAFPNAIDDAGRVVGAVASDEDHADGNMVDDVERAAYWPSVHARPRVLGPLAGDEGAHAYAIRGKEIGGVSSGDTFTPVVWDLGGRPEALRSSGAGAGAVQTFTSAGDPAGEAVLPGLGLRAVQWDRARRAHVLPGVGAGAESTVTSAAPGLLTGTLHDRSAGPGGRQTALVWRGERANVLSPLRSLRPARGPVQRGVGAVGAAASATAKGTVIVGYSTSADGTRFPTAWSCRS
jgi:uncharacterized membrane protein